MCSVLPLRATGDTVYKPQGMNPMTKSRFFFPGALAIAFGLAGCTGTAQKTVSVQHPVYPTAPEEAPVKPFPAETLYDLLVAEFAGSRNEYGVALTKYIKQAFATRDPVIVARAARVAALLDANNYAMKLAELWVELEPDSIEAHRFAAHYLGLTRQLVKAFPHAIYMLEHGESESLQALATYSGAAQEEQRAQLLANWHTLKPELANHPAALLTKATLLWHQGNADGALALVQHLLEQEPDNEPSLLLRVQILEQQGNIKAAQTALDDALFLLPNSKQLRLHAIQLWAGEDLTRTRQELATLAKLFPQDDMLMYSLALISVEVGMPDYAEKLLQNLLDSPTHSADAHYQLAKLMEQTNDIARAEKHYRQVRSGQHMLNAAAHVSDLMLAQNRLPEARLYLRQLRLEQPDQAAAIYQVESELLVQANQLEQAYDLLNNALEEMPGNSQLLYALSLVSERRGNIAMAEQSLRTILENNPNNAMVLNALGYSLTNHTSRYDEAQMLIRRALKLNPDDPATLDSLGWVLFHQGELEEALVYLQRAMSALPDPEVAAHLGEVLWTLGRRDEAIDVWQKSLGTHPNHPTITKTMDRLEVGH